MSAINSNSDDRDLEAIRRAQRAHEPSMEEILASIRNIIADEREPAKSAAPKPAPQRAAAPAAGPQIVYSKDGRRAPARRIRRRRSARKRRRRATRPRQKSSGASRNQPIPNPPPTRLRRDEEPLLSPEANEAVISSFGALSANLAMRSAELADGLVREMLRPMLKQWLDENLPDMSSDWCARKSSGSRAGRSSESWPRRSCVDFRRHDAFIALAAFSISAPGALSAARKTRHPILKAAAPAGHRADQNSMIDKSFDFAAVEGRASALWEADGSVPRRAALNGRRRSRFAS